MRRLWLTLLLTVGSFPALAIDGTHAGSWWNPDRAGEGIFFELVPQGDDTFVVAYFFTYDDEGNQAFLVGQGNAEGDTVVLETNVTSGGRFGDDLGEVGFEPWGTLTARFSGCGTLALDYARGETTGTIDLQRFKTPPRGVDGDCAGTTTDVGATISTVDGAAYGAWWDPERAGEGIFMEVWEDANGLPQLFAAWFTYLPDGSGRQQWIVGEGPIVGNRADLTAIVTRGPVFGEGYDPAAVEFEPWGYFSVRFTGEACGQAEIHYDAAGHGRGRLDQQPFVLPILGAPACTPETTDFRDQVVYFALTDRFANGDPSNDDGTGDRSGDTADQSNPLGWHGGDFAGLQAKIEEGYFNELGVTTLWISPIAKQVGSVDVGNGPNQGRDFAGYHAYWADDLDGIEPHFGSEAALRELVSAAHRNGLRIIFDVVVNHAGYDSSLLRTQPSWLRTGSECSGTDAGLCLAGLPDFKQELSEVTTFLNGRIDYWMSFAPDGMRMDTMKHVNNSYWRQFFVPDGAGDPSRFWTVGEVFSGDVGFLANYQDGLGSPSVFDFALYFAIKDSLAYGGSVNRIADVFRQDNRYRDATRLTTFFDNHDVPRFTSEAENAGLPANEIEERLDMAMSLLYFARGTPSVYYGTEIAMRGRGDPYDHPLGESNRENMDFDALAESSFDDRMAALAAVRREHPVLRFGAQDVVSSARGDDVLVLSRSLDGQRPVLIILNNEDEPADLANNSGIEVGGLFADGGFTELTGRPQEVTVTEGRLTGTVPARSVVALVQESQ